VKEAGVSGFYFGLFLFFSVRDGDEGGCGCRSRVSRCERGCQAAGGGGAHGSQRARVPSPRSGSTSNSSAKAVRPRLSASVAASVGRSLAGPCGRSRSKGRAIRFGRWAVSSSSVRVANDGPRGSTSRALWRDRNVGGWGLTYSTRTKMNYKRKPAGWLSVVLGISMSEWARMETAERRRKKQAEARARYRERRAFFTRATDRQQV
jgi:hypothetical protein